MQAAIKLIYFTSHPEYGVPTIIIEDHIAQISGEKSVRTMVISDLYDYTFEGHLVTSGATTTYEQLFKKGLSVPENPVNHDGVLKVLISFDMDETGNHSQIIFDEDEPIAYDPSMMFRLRFEEGVYLWEVV